MDTASTPLSPSGNGNPLLVHIAAELGLTKREDQLLVGFALETDNEEINALDKMRRKNLDIIVLNSLRDAGAGFGGDTNRITIFRRDGDKTTYPLESKKEAAIHIVDNIDSQFVTRNS